MTDQSQRFREYMGGFFHDFLRAAGITMGPGNSFERVRAVGERMARTIEAAAETQAIHVIKRLQEAVISSFNKVEGELNDLTELSGKHNTLIGDLIEEQKKTDHLVNNLLDRIQYLEAENRRDDIGC